MRRDIHSLSDLVTGTAAATHVPLFHTTGGWKTVPGIVDARADGVIGDGTTDNIAALTTAVGRCNSAAGTRYSTSGARTLYLPPGIYGFTGTLALSGWMNLLTEGAGNTIFKALDSTAKITIACDRGRFCGFTFDGNGVSTGGVGLLASTSSTFEDIHVYNCAGDGLHTHNLQNAVLSNCNAEFNTGSGIVVDDGTGSCVFIRCEANDNTKHQMLVTDTDTVASGYAQPSSNAFLACLTERVILADSGTATGGSTTTLVDSGKNWTVNQWAGAWVTKDPGGAAQAGVKILSNTSTTLTVESGVWIASPNAKTYRIHWPPLRIDASFYNHFLNHIISAGTGTLGEFPLLHMARKGGTEAVAQASFQNFIFTGSNSYHTAVEFDGSGGSVRLDMGDPNNSSFTGAKVGMRVQSGSGSRVTGSLPTLNSVTTPTSFVSGSLNSMFLDFRTGVQQAVTNYATTDRVEYNVISGESGMRFVRYANGKLGWKFDGSSFTEDVDLYPSAADVLKTDDQFYAAGGLTTSTKAGAPSDADTALDQDGTMILDTSNHRLYVRSGGSWKYAALT